MCKLLLAGAAVLALGVGAAQAAPARHTFAQFFQTTCNGSDQTLQTSVPTGFAGTLIDAEAIFDSVPSVGMTRAFTGQGANTSSMDTRFGVMSQGDNATHAIGGFPGFNFTGIAYPAIGVPVIVGSPVYVDAACPAGAGSYSGYAFYTVIF